MTFIYFDVFRYDLCHLQGVHNKNRHQVCYAKKCRSEVIIMSYIIIYITGKFILYIKRKYCLYRVIHKSVKHFKNSQQINHSTDHGSSYADREGNSPSLFTYFTDAQCVHLW